MGLAPEAASPWIYPFCKNTQRIPGVLLSQGVWICSLGHPHQVVARGVENQGHAVPPCLHLGIRVRSSQLIGFCVVLPWYAYPSLSTTVSQIYSDIIYDIIIQSEAINRCEVGQCWPGLEVWYGNEPSGCQRTGLFSCENQGPFFIHGPFAPKLKAIPVCSTAWETYWNAGRLRLLCECRTAFYVYAMCFAKKYVNMSVILAVGCILWAMERRDVRCAERKGNSSLVMTLTMGIQMHGNRRYGSLMKPPKCRNTIRVRS